MSNESHVTTIHNRWFGSSAVTNFSANPHFILQYEMYLSHGGETNLKLKK